MLIEFVWLVTGLTVFLSGLGLFMRDRIITFIGALLLILLGLILLVPSDVGGGVQSITSSNQTTAYSYTGGNLTETVKYDTPIKEHIAPSWVAWLWGIAYLGVGVYLMAIVWVTDNWK